MQLTQERCDAGLSFGIVRRQRTKYADAPRSLTLLRACGERPGSRPKDQVNKTFVASSSRTGMAAQNNPSCLVRAENCAATVQSNLGHILRRQLGRSASDTGQDRSSAEGFKRVTDSDLRHV